MPESSPSAVGTLLCTGPFHLALRAAIQERGLTLERLRAHLARRGISIGLSSLSEWQQGHSRPASSKSLQTLRALEEVLGLPPSSLVGLLDDAAPSDRLGEGTCALGELLDALPGSREYTTDVVNQQDKVFVDAEGRSSRVWSRTTVRARRDGVDRYVLRYFGDPGCDIEQVEFDAIENCRLGRVLRHPTEPVLVAELLFAQALRAGDTWVFERQVSDGTGNTSAVYAHAFRQPEQQYLLEVRFHPALLPARCYAFAQADLHDERRHTGDLRLNAHHAVHLIASDATTGVVGIGWEWAKTAAHGFVGGNDLRLKAVACGSGPAGCRV